MPWLLCLRRSRRRLGINDTAEEKQQSLYGIEYEMKKRMDKADAVVFLSRT